MKIAIIYHSGYGHTKTLAEAVTRGAESVEGIEVRLFAATEITPESTETWQYLDEADAHIYGSPTYMGAISAGLKQLFEQRPAIERWLSGKWANKIAAGFSNSASPSGDKLNTLLDMVVIAMQFGFVWVGLAEPPAGKHGGNIEDINRLGAWVGAMSQSPGHDDPLPGDQKSGESLGKRVAESVVRWNAQA